MRFKIPQFCKRNKAVRSFYAKHIDKKNLHLPILMAAWNNQENESDTNLGFNWRHSSFKIS